MFETIKNVVTLVMFGFASPFGLNIGTEELHYQTIEKLDNGIDIREYDERVAAETTVTGEPADQARREGFEIIAGYIFGKNIEKKNIAMTSPVEVGTEGKRIAMTSPVEISPSSSSMLMRFFMPAEYKIASLPVPRDSRIRLITIPKSHYAVLRFTGSTSDRKVAIYSQKLLDGLKKTHWRETETVRAYFYNPPWTIPFLRRNEVVVEVEAAK